MYTAVWRTHAGESEVHPTTKKKRYESIKRIDSNFSDGRAAQSALSTVITVAGILGQVLGQTFQTMISFHCRKNIGSLFGRWLHQK